MPASKRTPGPPAAARCSTRPGDGRSSRVRILRVEAALQRVPAAAHVASCANGERPARRDLDLQAHEVEAGDGLRDGVLDLQARVHLQEVEAPVGVEQELDGARVHVARRPRGGHAGLAQRAPLRRGAAPGWASPPPPSGGGAGSSTRAPAGGAIVPVRVGQHLHLDVARPLDEALEHHRVVAEGRARLAPRRRPARAAKSAARAHDAHALAAAAARGLDHHRPADAAGLGRERRVVLVVAVVARHAPARRRRPSAGARPSCRPSRGARRRAGR